MSFVISSSFRFFVSFCTCVFRMTLWPPCFLHHIRHATSCRKRHFHSFIPFSVFFLKFCPSPSLSGFSCHLIDQKIVISLLLKIISGIGMVIPNYAWTNQSSPPGWGWGAFSWSKCPPKREWISEKNVLFHYFFLT